MSVTDIKMNAQPIRWKLALLTWVGIYPLITLLLWILGPLLGGLPLPLVTLMLTVALVATMTFVVMPFLTRTFGTWLRAPQRAAVVTAASDA